MAFANKVSNKVRLYPSLFPLDNCKAVSQYAESFLSEKDDKALILVILASRKHHLDFAIDTGSHVLTDTLMQPPWDDCIPVYCMRPMSTAIRSTLQKVVAPLAVAHQALHCFFAIQIAVLNSHIYAENATPQATRSPHISLASAFAHLLGSDPQSFLHTPYLMQSSSAVADGQGSQGKERSYRASF